MDNSGLNTVLIIILLGVVGLLAWWFIGHENEKDNSSAAIEVTIPTNDDES